MVKYYYEGYGKLIYVEDTSGINLANINPFRYKSYYYDIETGWYYLNSRYYDPIASRFVTMDQVEYLGASSTIHSLNLFTYCEGNPVVRIDSRGNFWELIVYAIIALIVIVIALVADPYRKNKKEKKDKIKDKNTNDEIISDELTNHIIDTVEVGPAESAMNIYRNLAGGLDNTAKYDDRYSIWETIGN